MSCNPPTWFDRSFSRPRLAPYLTAASRDGIHAIDLYQWNMQVCEAFVPALSCLEVNLRNALHDQLRIRYGRDNWWGTAPLTKFDMKKVRQAEADASKWKGGGRNADDIVAELSLGFWVSLLSTRYDRHFWVPALHRAFPGYRGGRAALHKDFESIRYFRNRIAHHEPVHHRHLEADHNTIYQLLGYLEPNAVAWLRKFDRVPAVLINRPGGSRTPASKGN